MITLIGSSWPVSAKARLNDTYNLVSSEGIQMHGGIGMTDEYEIGFFLKRSRVCEHTLVVPRSSRSLWCIASY